MTTEYEKTVPDVTSIRNGLRVERLCFLSPSEYHIDTAPVNCEIQSEGDM